MFGGFGPRKKTEAPEGAKEEEDEDEEEDEEDMEDEEGEEEDEGKPKVPDFDWFDDLYVLDTGRHYFSLISDTYLFSRK